MDNPSVFPSILTEFEDGLSVSVFSVKTTITMSEDSDINVGISKGVIDL